MNAPNLLDVNFLIALAWPIHVHHEKAHAWFKKNSESEWVTTPLTQAGFIRISSNKKIFDQAVSPVEASRLLKDMVAHPRHGFWEDSLSFFSKNMLNVSLITGHRQVTDFYLLALAKAKKGRLVTFDQGLGAFRETCGGCLEIVF